MNPASTDPDDLGSSADFRGAEIRGDACFNKAIIRKNADFDISVIRGDAMFMGAVIGRNASFREICGTTWFEWAKIGGDARFAFSKLGGDAGSGDERAQRYARTLRKEHASQ
ncbi:hypothetical protein ACFYXW_18095 [Streptomyces sp. NPDC001981]|uniref:hypothetical protein n=1 Tax=Streptomyces sp. NPDC001981 TaxID=3364628 RepID=UPI00369E42E4